MKKKKQDKIHFAIKQIRTEQFACPHEKASEGKAQVNTELRFGIDVSKRILAVFSKFQFNQNEKLIIILEIVCAFEVHKDSWSGWIIEDKVHIPQNFLRHLSVITVGCARGVIHAKTEGTTYNNLIIPTVNLNKLVTEDLVIDFEGKLISLDK